ncbi:MAG: hypothetical protein BMS9Abin10_0392 [Gammaproteobacteria bacterium]|nr:MAG: hypothetical protein BMS9Abin10_0392 [Gammaproteobacteria bacterium]
MNRTRLSTRESDAAQCRASSWGQGAKPHSLQAALDLKILAAGLALVTSLILARPLGASGYGTYAYAMACLGLRCLPSS